MTNFLKPNNYLSSGLKFEVLLISKNALYNIRRDLIVYSVLPE